MNYFKYFLFLLLPHWCFCAISEGNREIGFKKVVYTCICGDYDSLISHSYVCNDWDYICFTDNQELLKNGHNQWTIRPLEYAERDNTRNNRWHKIFPHKLLPEYDISLYIDGNINIKSSDLFEYISKVLVCAKSKTLVINKHCARNCIYEEAEACKAYQLDCDGVIDKQMFIFKKLLYPKSNGLTENFMIYRCHHNKQVKKIMKEWWWWVSNYSKRDQLSFNFVLWNHGFKIYLFEEKFSRTGGCLEFLNHERKGE